MECDSVLGQQSISGKNVSLILCVWKPCYVKSGHNYRIIVYKTTVVVSVVMKTCFRVIFNRSLIQMQLTF